MSLQYKGRGRGLCLRFSMRVMLIVLTTVCIVLARWVERSERQRQAVAALRAIVTCEIYYDFDPRGPNPELARVLYPAEAPPPPGWAARRIGIDYFHGAVTVIVPSAGLPSARPRLARLPSLREIYVFDNEDDEKSQARIDAAIRRLRSEFPGVTVEEHSGGGVCFSTIPVVG